MTKNKTINFEGFSVKSSEFIKAEKSSSISQLLHIYFTKNKTVSQEFINELADRYPTEFLNAIRVNKAFLIPGHFTSLGILENHSNTKLSEHYRFFRKLQEIEYELYSEFEKTLMVCKDQGILDVLIWVSFWFEDKRAVLFQTKLVHLVSYDIHPIIEVIDFFLSHYLFIEKEKITASDLKNEDDIIVLGTCIEKALKMTDLNEHPVWKALNTAFTYHNFLKTTIEIYCFDMNYDISIDDGKASLKYKDDKKLKRWFVENEKLRYWYDYYRDISTDRINIEVQKNANFIKNTSGIDYTMNYEGAIRFDISRSVASDFCIDESILMGVPTPSLITILNGFVHNAWGRFVQPMDQLNFKNPKNWLKNIVINSVYHGNYKAQIDGQQIAAFPSRFSDRETLKGLIHYNVNGSETYSDQLIDLISFDITKYGYIDRLNTPLNLIGKPFIKLNNFYFAFNGILGETNSHVNVLLNAMESNSLAHSFVTQKEVESMEKKICGLFRGATFINSDHSRKYYEGENEKGDFDVMVYENGVFLLIELKRSKFRLHLSDAHDEYQNSLTKAVKQIEKADNYIRDNFEKCKREYFDKLNIKENSFTELKFYPIIVTTSFEQDHNAIEGKYLKISLFELEQVLRAPIEPVTGNILEDLIMKLLRNEFWSPLEDNFELPDLSKYTLTMPF